jgi:hypothetical protein
VSRSLLERRLVDVSERLKRLRAESGVLAEQVEHFESEATDAELRALVSETPLADRDAQAARRHADAHRRQREDLLRSITELEREQDSLLDRMAAELPD